MLTKIRILSKFLLKLSTIEFPLLKKFKLKKEIKFLEKKA